MIWGTVSTDREAQVRLRIRGPAGIDATVTVIVDTAFSASLTLPDALIQKLGLVLHSNGTGVLADGASVQFDVYLAEVEWGGVWQPVLVSAVGGKPLLGMRMLVGHELRVTVVPGGAVEISPLA